MELRNKDEHGRYCVVEEKMTRYFTKEQLEDIIKRQEVELVENRVLLSRIEELEDGVDPQE